LCREREEHNSPWPPVGIRPLTNNADRA
jgi:hypothetical protein